MDEYYRILESLPPALRTPLAKLDATMRRTFRRSVCGWAARTVHDPRQTVPRGQISAGTGLPAALETDTCGTASAALPPLGLRL